LALNVLRVTLFMKSSIAMDNISVYDKTVSITKT